MAELRYMVQSEHVRGERRSYYIWDRDTRRQASRDTYDARTAARWCDRANAGLSVPN